MTKGLWPLPSVSPIKFVHDLVSIQLCGHGRKTFSQPAGFRDAVHVPHNLARTDEPRRFRAALLLLWLLRLLQFRYWRKHRRADAQQTYLVPEQTALLLKFLASFFTCYEQFEP